MAVVGFSSCFGNFSEVSSFSVSYLGGVNDVAVWSKRSSTVGVSVSVRVRWGVGVSRVKWSSVTVAVSSLSGFLKKKKKDKFFNLLKIFQEKLKNGKIFKTNVSMGSEVSSLGVSNLGGVDDTSIVSQRCRRSVVSNCWCEDVAHVWMRVSECWSVCVFVVSIVAVVSRVAVGVTGRFMSLSCQMSCFRVSYFRGLNNAAIVGQWSWLMVVTVQVAWCC